MKVLNLINTAVESHESVADGLLNYMPNGFSEVAEWENILDADISLLCSSSMNNEQLCNLNLPNQGTGNHNELDMSNFDALYKVMQVLNDKPRIIYFDKFPQSPVDQLPEYVRGIDIPVGTVELPEHPNRCVTHFIDDRKFYISHRLLREDKSVGVMQQDLENETLGLVARLLNEGYYL